MITRISGILQRVLDEEVRLLVGPLEYQVLVPEFVRRQLQAQLGRETTLAVFHYLEGNPNQGRMVPRLVGFVTEEEMDFFELFCEVDKIGVKKALKALARPPREIADAIQRQDGKWLTTLPGIGPGTAEKIVATLKRKVTRFALSGGASSEGTGGAVANIPGALMEDAYQALLTVGHSPQEARSRLDKVLAEGGTFSTVQEILLAVYK